ncbi:DUF4166 domain-containing protein [Sanguibacter sp. 4.1]|uniref:DUF4166 domain-containing protein n=1 Tax=Sanguibacter biliveldensis TaxID=3030830 RepID=A0AAF1BXP8_9MICO|nr:DUF4166 domain-containing protein [Sanguibacter sp. 4.1]WPF81976.1 DUF4166 domain-containing protein [Sanguibacter sp. 4.1]
MTTSVFAQALGSDVERLHPQMRRRFGLTPDGENACVGRGVMDSVWRGPLVTVPFLWFGAWRNILVPRTGKGVPFTIENYCYVDGLGRDTTTFVRTFEFPRHRRSRFDATMVYDPASGRVLDYLGTHQHLAVDLDLEVDERGGLLLRSGAQRFYEGPVGFSFPMAASGTAELHEHYDDQTERFRIDLTVSNPVMGPIFGYRGSFTCNFSTIPAASVPASAKPLREEARG